MINKRAGAFFIFILHYENIMEYFKREGALTVPQLKDFGEWN